jgi:RNA polymerase sigma factor (sigma-70 family)
MENEIYSDEINLQRLVVLAKKGRRKALEELVGRIQDRIYGMALRTLFLPEDAEDATQEILIKIITHLGNFKGESRFTTWCFRIAVNHLLSVRKQRAERWFSFEKCGQAIEEAQSMSPGGDFESPEDHLLLEEVRLACLQGVLICLRRDIRMAFILGVVFEVTSGEGSQILGISPEAYRQRLSRGRKQIQEFMTKKCSLVKPGNPCTCAGLLPYEIKVKLLDPKKPRFATHRCHASRNGWADFRLHELDELKRIAFLFRSQPDYAAPKTFVESIRELLDSRRLEILNDA